MLTPVKRPSRTITNVKREADKLCLSSEYGILQIAPKSETVLRITFAEADALSDATGVGIINDAPFAQWDFDESAEAVTLRTAALQAQICKKSGSIRYCRADGTLLLAERGHESRILDGFDSYKTVIDNEAKVETLATADGEKKRIRSATRVFDKKLYRTRLHMAFQENEALFGLGQTTEGTLCLRGTTQYMHQANMKIPIPFLISNKGYGLLWATGSPCIFTDTDYGSYLQTEADAQMDFYFIGGAYNDIIKSYRYLTGKAAMLPKWAFGYMQSQERYESAEELIATVKEYRKRGVGLDCIILDWMSWPDGQWGQKSFDEKRFPDPTAMMEEIHQLGARMMISIWPTMNRSSANHAEFQEKGLMFPFCDIYNTFEKEARDLYWKQANEGLFRHGVDAWWCDSTEPYTPEWTKDTEPEPSALYHEFMRESANFAPAEWGNAFCLFHAQGMYEGQRGENSGKRVVNLTRSGWTGSQRYGTIMWSGDISASWAELQKQIVVGLQFCACGLPYWTQDIGAFFVKQGKPWYWNGSYEGGESDLGYRELYVRWFQYGAFLPVFRAHGTDVRREVWAYGKPGEPFYDALCAAVELRYKLMPYIYSLAGAAWYDDAVIMRFLAFDFPHDEQAVNIGDQYMFGPSLMVCPVTTPMMYGIGSTPIEGAAFTRRVYLPKGTRWYDFWTNEVYEGGQWIEAAADIGRIPLFVPKGSIIPMTEAAQHTGEKPDAPITLRPYPGKDGEFVLYEDDNDGYAYENGVYRLTKITWDDAAQQFSQTVVHDHPDVRKGTTVFQS